MTAQFSTTSTPDGPFTIITDDDAVLASGWTGEVSELFALIHPSIRPARPEHTENPTGFLNEAISAVLRYYDDEHAAPGFISVRQMSGPFRQHSWEVLRLVKPGEVITYSEYASRCGNPKAVRAAASACAFNAAALFVPCHRVLRTDGTLGGFRYGLPIKESLLRRES